MIEFERIVQLEIFFCEFLKCKCNQWLNKFTIKTVFF